MSAIVKCDQCEAERKPDSWDSAHNWIEVRHQMDLYSRRRFREYPKISGDYCSYECLLGKLSLAVEKCKQVKMAGLADE